MSKCARRCAMPACGSKQEDNMRQRDWLRVFVCIGLGTLLGGCTTLSNMMPESKKVDYKSSGRLPPLEIPPDLTRPSSDERYVVPDINTKSTATYSEYSRDRAGKPRAEVASGVLPAQENVRVERE